MARLGYAGKLFKEFVDFARQNRMYWIVALILLLGLASFLVVSGQAMAPLIYTLF
jgi:hypothetical protein